MFYTLHYLPDPIPTGDGHYKIFADVYGQNTSEQYCPSLQIPKKNALVSLQASNMLGMSASSCNVKNVTCGNCYFAGKSSTSGSH